MIAKCFPGALKNAKLEKYEGHRGLEYKLEVEV